ncbi:sodium channel modifier 1 isoform X3 [Tachysurus vachellii]|uniref:sodium channel modifier 1 isoform X3 n=1 Tax=Tachysurus vachellii TaxID=175792 RepID=UPI00296AF4C4|nr:sodium channel modifier 1 isoform X3 [Tachysurus vachellii]
MSHNSFEQTGSASLAVLALNMSFKREGNDSSQLNVLKKRRVADLLANYISEDEATLMKNGRYSCLVCSQRPVFDTVDMLTVHRKGKRHLEGLKWFYGKKARLKNEIDKRRHQEYVNEEDDRQETGSSAPLLTQTRKIAHHALLKTTPYNSCHKKASERCENPVTPDCSRNYSVDQNIIPRAKSQIYMDTTPVPADASHHRIETQMKKKKRKAANPAASEPVTEQRCRELEHYLKLKSNGWIQDPSGKWVKDENVEFDSDEEEPLPPLPTNGTS